MNKAAILALVFAAVGAQAPSAFCQPESDPSASAEDAVKRASERFQRGVGLYREGSFDAALAEFELAYEISPNYRVLYNVGQVQVQRGDYVGAVNAFRQYLEDGGDEVSDLRRSELEAEIGRLQGRIATLRVTSNVDGAELIVDGVSLGTLSEEAGTEGVPVNAGVRRVVVKKDGYVTHEAPVTLAGGEATEVEVSLQALEPAPSGKASGPEVRIVRVPTAPAAGAGEASSSTGFWVSLAVTGGAAIATGVLAWRTQAADDDYTEELETYPGSESGITAARDKLEQYALFTDIAAGATVLGLGATLYFAFSGGDGGAAPPADTATIRTGPKGMGWQVSGRF